MQEPDPQVVAAARSGDLGAFESLVRIFQADVWRFSIHLLGDEAAADDITQEAFLRVFRFLPRYRGESKFSTWLFSIARNCALDEVRKAQRKKRIGDRLAAEPERVSADQGLAVEVREALLELPVDIREPIVLIDMFGMTYKDVATMLDLPVGTIKSRVHRAREAMLGRLAPEGKKGAEDA